MKLVERNPLVRASDNQLITNGGGETRRSIYAVHITVDRALFAATPSGVKKIQKANAEIAWLWLEVAISRVPSGDLAGNTCYLQSFLREVFCSLYDSVHSDSCVFCQPGNESHTKTWIKARQK